MKPACGASAAQSTSEAALPDWPRRIGAAWIFVDKNCWKPCGCGWRSWYRRRRDRIHNQIEYFQHRLTLDPHLRPLPVKTYHDSRNI